MEAQNTRPVAAIALVGFFIAIVVVTVGGFALGWRPVLASKQGAGIDMVISYLLVVTGLIVIIGHAVLGMFVWKASRAPAGPDGYQRPSRRTEGFWGLLPVVVMLVLSEVGVLVLAAPVTKDLYIDPPVNPVIVEVVGKQFEWISRYPGKDGVFGRTKPELVHDQRNPVGLDKKDPAAKDDIVMRGELHLPVDRDVMLRLRTQDVLHSFFVAQFRVKQDLISGFPTSLKFQPTRTGRYEIACAELCGLGHFRMRGYAIIVEKPEFERWLSEQLGWFE